MGIKYKIIIENFAKKDILSIYNYISNILGNIIAADRLMNKINEKFNEIAVFPKSTPLLNNEYVNKDNIRKLIIENYIAFYEINEERHEIIILRILHCTMNYINII